MAIPVIFVIIGVAAALTGGGLIAYKKLKGKKLGVLGMKRAGKTLFWYHLQDKKYVEGKDEDTINDNIPAFIVEGTNDKKLKISGRDIGGGLDFFQDYYKNIIDECKYNVFIFDMYEYVNNKDYKNITNSLFEVLYNYKCFIKKPYAVIGTHLDQFTESPRTVQEKILTMLGNKPYKALLNSGNFYAIDMRIRNDAMDVFKKLVK